MNKTKKSTNNIDWNAMEEWLKEQEEKGLLKNPEQAKKDFEKLLDKLINKKDKKLKS